jgi:hypothetical protein
MTGLVPDRHDVTKSGAAWSRLPLIYRSKSRRRPFVSLEQAWFRQRRLAELARTGRLSNLGVANFAFELSVGPRSNDQVSRRCGFRHATYADIYNVRCVRAEYLIRARLSLARSMRQPSRPDGRGLPHGAGQCATWIWLSLRAPVSACGTAR